MGDLLTTHVQALSAGELEIVPIARHRGILAKVAVRRRPGVRLRGYDLADFGPLMPPIPTWPCSIDLLRC
jgi:hypothetical protein